MHTHTHLHTLTTNISKLLHKTKSCTRSSMKLVLCQACFIEVWPLRNPLHSIGGGFYLLYILVIKIDIFQNEHFLTFSDENINMYICIHFSSFSVHWVRIISSIWVLLLWSIRKFKFFSFFVQTELPFKVLSETMPSSIMK